MSVEKLDYRENQVIQENKVNKVILDILENVVYLDYRESKVTLDQGVIPVLKDYRDKKEKLVQRVRGGKQEPMESREKPELQEGKAQLVHRENKDYKVIGEKKEKKEK